MVNAISRQILELWNRYKPTIAVNAIEYDRELKKLLGTNLAEVGTDCISRADAIKIVQNRCKRYTTACVLAVTEIKQLPPIQPKRGKWNRLGRDVFNCNKCGATFVLNQGGEKMRFCPNCGADMREVTT